MTERDWEEYVEDRESAESEERWLVSERRDWAQAVIEKLEKDRDEVAGLAQSSGDAHHAGMVTGIRLALSYLYE